MTCLQRTSLAATLEVPVWLACHLDPTASTKCQTLLDNEQALYTALIAIERLVKNNFGTGPFWGGAQRSVFPVGDAVLKLPWVDGRYHRYFQDPQGYLESQGQHPACDALSLAENVLANVAEAMAYETNALGKPVAPCRLLWHQSGVPLLLMEKVETEYAYDQLPDWNDVFERKQVGYSSLLDDWAGFDAGMPPEWFEPGDDSNMILDRWIDCMADFITEDDLDDELTV